MLFNSYEFIFLFLPVVWVGYQCLSLPGWSRAAVAWLVAASLVYYGYWDPRFVPVIGASIGVNYAVGFIIGTSAHRRVVVRRMTLIAGVAFNVLLLGYFKYTNFFVDNLSRLTGAEIEIGRIVLPIGISFFTFQQIAYLVDSFRREAVERDFLRYGLFVSFFPQLIAGPIVHHREMMPQFGTQKKSAVASDLAVGFTIFVIGLFKKMVIADTMAAGSSPVFDAVAAGVMPGLWESWSAALSYGMQIYFDFSGYSDMAIGIGRSFGIRLPINFASPYKASSIIEFWRRWHITLSRFLRDYLYYPLGGNRRGAGRRYANVLITMILGGIWHGAGWTFLLWGTMHGVFLVANQLWRHAAPWRFGGPWAGRLLTFFCVTIAWVPFRAADLKVVGVMYGSMLGLNGGAPSALFGSALDLTSDTIVLLWLPLVLLVALFLPNTQQWMRAADPGLPLSGYPATLPSATEGGLPIWRPSRGVALLVGLMFVLSVLKLDDISEFIYFQF